MIRVSMAGMCTFIIQSAQSSDSGAQGNFFLSSSVARANAARVFEQSYGPFILELKGSNRRRISAILDSRRATSSSALAVEPKAGEVFFISDATPRAMAATAGGPVRSKRPRPTKLGSTCAWSASRSGLLLPLRW